MPWADYELAEALSDPDFARQVEVTRTRQTVDEGGMAHGQVRNQFGIVCVLMPAGSRTLNRLPEGERLAGTVDVYSRYPLTAGDKEFDADLVLWQGQQYTVTSVDEFTDFGFVHATAQLLQISGAEPKGVDI